jgi:hypothetical protein
MPRIRFRIRTIMVVTAVLAVLLWVARALWLMRALSRLRVWVQMGESDVVMRVGSPWYYSQIPLAHVVYLVALVAVFFAVYSYYRDNWMRPGQASKAANRSIGGRNRDSRGARDSVG